MAWDEIPDGVKRFILTSITSVPYLEAILLLRRESEQTWNPKSVAQRLYINEKKAEELLSDLHAAGFVTVSHREVSLYGYQPSSEELRKMIDQLAATYSTHIIEVTNLIHSNAGNKVQQFADAFKWRKGF